jgi:hypothetical protein
VLHRSPAHMAPHTLTFRQICANRNAREGLDRLDVRQCRTACRVRFERILQNPIFSIIYIRMNILFAFKFYSKLLKVFTYLLNKKEIVPIFYVREEVVARESRRK